MSLKIERVEVFGVATPLVGEYLTSGSIALPPGPGYGVTPDDQKLVEAAT